MLKNGATAKHHKIVKEEGDFKFTVVNGKSVPVVRYGKLSLYTGADKGGAELQGTIIAPLAEIPGELRKLILKATDGDYLVANTIVMPEGDFISLPDFKGFKEAEI